MVAIGMRAVGNCMDRKGKKELSTFIKARKGQRKKRSTSRPVIKEKKPAV